MSHIESRPSRDNGGYDFYVEFICGNEELLNQLTAKLEEIASTVSLMTEGGRGNKGRYCIISFVPTPGDRANSSPYQ